MFPSISVINWYKKSRSSGIVSYDNTIPYGLVVVVVVVISLIMRVLYIIGRCLGINRT